MADIAPAAPSAPATSPAAPSAPAPAASTAPVVANTPASVAETKKSRRYPIKVDGQVEEVDLDSLSDEEIIKDRQMSRAAARRMQESAETKKAFQNIMEMIKKDPVAALKDPAFGGLDVRKQIEEQLIREYQESQMDEPSRKAAQLQRDLDTERARISEYEGRQKAEAQTKLEARVFEDTQRDFIAALEASDMPKTKETLAIMAQVAQAALENGIDLSPQQLAAEAKNRVFNMHKHVVGALKGEALIKHLGPDVVKEVIRHEVARVKASKGQPVAPPVNQDVSDSKDRPERKIQDFSKVKRFFKDL